mmetsp:Transcript_10477/g.10325  ORF Transcript_10477/g.10325 Transcript_10477/m.10325 type:complete len:135 (+) Transcript_10477:361-765(+)
MKRSINKIQKVTEMLLSKSKNRRRKRLTKVHKASLNKISERFNMYSDISKKLKDYSDRVRLSTTTSVIHSSVVKYTVKSPNSKKHKVCRGATKGFIQLSNDLKEVNSPNEGTLREWKIDESVSNNSNNAIKKHN